MSRVQIAVPVYNGEQHLKECLLSIATQTLSDWQAVIVNNCSTDQTGEIAASFAEQDSRFRVVHCEEFLSQSENYNRAIKSCVSAGEYFKMVEADNVLWPECLERMVAVGDRDPEIGIVGGYWLHGKQLKGEGVRWPSELLEGTQVLREHLLTDAYYLGTPTTLLFRAAALAVVEPGFRPGLFFDDVDLCFRLLRDWKFGFVHQVLAFVRNHNGGLFEAFSDFDYIPAYRYLLAMTYGREVFDGREAERVQQWRRSLYCRSLATAMADRRPQAYWDFHRSAARIMGYELRYRDLIWPLILVLLDRVFNPKRTVMPFIRRALRALWTEARIRGPRETVNKDQASSGSAPEKISLVH
jgi:glycosyltransferase involved in cell wall biosynthesis